MKVQHLHQGIRLACGALASFLLAGCITMVSSKPATETSSGIRYALPIPVLKVVPQSDGTMALEVLYIPDPKRTYVIESWSILGAYTLDIKLKEGLLDTVAFHPDGTGVGSQLLSSYGDIRKAHIDAAAKAQEDATKKADEKAKESATAAKALMDAQTALAIAQKKLAKLQELSPGDTNAILAAELAIVEARTKLEALQTAAAGEASLNAMNKAANTSNAGQTAAGPVFYRLSPDTGGSGRVDLVRDQEQIVAPTARPVKVSAQKPGLKLQIEGRPSIAPGPKGLVLKVRSNQPIHSVDKEDIELIPQQAGVISKPIQVASISVEEGITYLYVVLDGRQEPGTYRMRIPVRLEKNAPRASSTPLDFVIQPAGR